MSRGEATRSEGLGKAGTEERLLSQGTATRGLMRPHVPAEPSARRVFFGSLLLLLFGLSVDLLTPPGFGKCHLESPHFRFLKWAS